MTLRNYKFAVFSALVLSMIIPFAGINMVHASQTAGDPYHIGKVEDGTYNEEVAFQRMVQLVNMYDEERQKKTELEQKLAAATDSTEIEAIKSQINDAQGEIDQITQEYNEIQKENKKLYYIEPSTYEKYVTAKDDVINKINKQYWEGKSFEEAKNAFPLVGGAIDHKQKAVEILLWKEIVNSPEKDKYVAIIDELMPNNVPWFVSFADYPTPTACESRTISCDPMIGGIQVHVSGSPISCTLGFQAIRNGVDGFVTAGHCADGLAVGSDVFQPVGGSAKGDLVVESFANNSPCDCAFVSNRTSSPMDNAIFQSSTSTYTPISTTSAADQAGDQVKKSGVRTGNTLGTVTDTSVTITYEGNQITNLVNSTMFVNCGDSGAPVTNGFGSSLYGVVVAKNGACDITTNVAYHSPYDQITATIQANAVLG